MEKGRRGELKEWKCGEAERWRIEGVDGRRGRVMERWRGGGVHLLT